MRTLRGNKRDMPPGLEPMEWAREVFALMDEGKTEAEARRLVAEKYQKEGDGNGNQN